MTCPMCGNRFDGMFDLWCRCTRADWDRYDAEQKAEKAEKAEKAKQAEAEAEKAEQKLKEEGIALFHEAAALVAEDIHQLFMEASDPNRFPG